MRVATLLSALLILALVASSTARAAPRGARTKRSQVAVGDALDIRAPDSYLGKNWQVVSVITPYSSNRRVVDHKTGNFSGMQRRRGLITWMKKREPWPFERLQRKPFTHRYLRMDPRGVALSMAQEGKLDLNDDVVNGRRVVSISLAKPDKPWYRRLF